MADSTDGRRSGDRKGRPSSPRGSSSGAGTGRSGSSSGGARRGGSTGGAGGSESGRSSGSGSSRGGSRTSGASGGGERRSSGTGARSGGGSDKRGASGKPRYTGTARPSSGVTAKKPDRERPTESRDDTPPAKRKPWATEGELPRWIQEEISRVTAKQRVAATVELLQNAAREFASGKYGKALRDAEEAKELAPRVATVREVLGLAAYRLGRWEVALRELRAFRRFTGETTHMPVEMDVLRALERPDDVEDVWKTFRKLGGDRATDHEARVVYASFLLDIGEDRRAWDVTNPKRIGKDPVESELRVWFVASRAAARLGDLPTARRLYEAIQAADPGFPGLDELDRASAGA